MNVRDVTGFDPPYLATDGSLLLKLHTEQEGKIDLLIDAALVADLTLALVTRVIEGGPVTAKTKRWVTAPKVAPAHIRLTTAFHPDGVSWRGVCVVQGQHSLCRHAHPTEAAAIRCAERKRAAYNRGDWTL